MLDVSQTDLVSFQTDERSIPSDGENAALGDSMRLHCFFFEAGGKSSVLSDIEVKVFEPRDVSQKRWAQVSRKMDKWASRRSLNQVGSSMAERMKQS